MISFEQLENIMPAAPQRILKFDAVKTALEQARKHNRVDFYNRLETGLEHMTLQNKWVITLRVIDFRRFLTEETQPCSVNFWRHKLNAEVDKTNWEAVFKSTKETRLRVLNWKILHNIYPTNIITTQVGN